MEVTEELIKNTMDLLAAMAAAMIAEMYEEEISEKEKAAQIIKAVQSIETAATPELHPFAAFSRGYQIFCILEHSPPQKYNREKIKFCLHGSFSSKGCKNYGLRRNSLRSYQTLLRRFCTI